MFDLAPKHPFLIGIDSDGCVFDTMEVKHKECFAPHVIKFYGLAGVSKFAREACDFVNLYSKSRGVNRFPALIEELDLIAARPEVLARGVKIEVPPSVREWVAREPKPGNPSLEKAVAASGDADLRRLLDWSKAVNRAIEETVYNVPPFPWVRDCLERMVARADVAVVSATPHEALEREWHEHDLARYVVAICGQEVGTKKECLQAARHYPPCHALMIGDAPGDYKAAAANAALFFPINPGYEEASWKRLLDEGLDRFFSGTFAGNYQDELLADFDRYLPEHPPWKRAMNDAAADRTGNRTSEIIFQIEESPRGGYEARALSAPIFTEADSLEELRAMVRDAVLCHFDDALRPQVICLHFVRDEYISI